MLITSNNLDFARVPVDQGQTGFFEGREFRIVRKLSVTAGTPVVWKFVSPVDFILFEQTFGASEGDIEFYAWVASNITEGGAFDTTVPSTGKNRSSEYREYDGGRYEQQATITTGGTATPIDAEEYVDYDRANVSNSTLLSSSVGGAEGSERYLPAGTYYLVFTSLNGTSEGRYAIAWEERPASVQP